MEKFIAKRSTAMTVLKTIGILLAVKVAEAFFSTGHAVLKQATKAMEKKLQ